MIGTTISHYKIIDELGRGGMGVVYKAEDNKLKRTVALKFLPTELTRDEETKKRFIHEAQTASALEHINICNIHEIDQTDDGQLFISMAYYEGESLKKRIEGERLLPIEAILDIAIQTAKGLTIAHESNIIHRDLKPANIMITDRGEVKIVDFGLAKLAGQTKLTKEGTTLGTVAYMSTEQAKGEEVDHRSDIWSLGVILYEMLTGQLPFTGEYESAIIYSILNDNHEPVTALRTGVSMELERLVNKCLQKNPDDRYQHVDELIVDLKHEQKQSEYLHSSQISQGQVGRKRKRLSPVWVSVTILFIFAILFIIFNPFQINIGQQKGIEAKENRLAIMYFNNLADSQDSEKLGEIATNLLITDLAESHYLDIVSSQRLYDILKLLGREGEKKIDIDVATEVAIKARCRWMLLGSILQSKPQIIITSQLVNVASGSAIASQRITGEVDDNIFTLVDKLTKEIKNDLDLPIAAMKEADRPVADVTTHSPEAYRSYLMGMECMYKVYFKEAEQYFTKSVDYDSTFAGAYLWLGWFKRGTPEGEKMIAKAERYSDNLSQKEKHYIMSMKAVISKNYGKAIQEIHKIIKQFPDDKRAFLWLGIIYHTYLKQPQEAIQALTKAVEIDPLDKFPYNSLAYAYNSIGDIDKSIWAINQYISLAPDEANPHDSRGDLYRFNGKIDQAIESYRKALEIKPDFYGSLAKLGHMYLFKSEYSKADSCFRELSASGGKNTRSEGRLNLALIPLYQGRFQEAIEVLDDGIAADRMEQAKRRANSDKHLQKAIIYGELKNLILALKEIDRSIEIYQKVYPDNIHYRRHYYVQLLAENGDFKKAEEIAKALEKDIEEKDRTLMYFYWWAAGYIEFSRGNFELSVSHFEKAAKDNSNFVVHYMLAKAYLAMDRLGEAVTNFERALSRYDESRKSHIIWAVKANYLLGLAYEKSGWKAKAVEKFKEFLDIWNHADPGIKEIEDAKARVEALKGNSSK